jgi:hypothetical protein
MTTNVLVTFYSTYGHIHRMALAVAEGAESVPDSTVRLRRIAELEEARKALSAQDAYVRARTAVAVFAATADISPPSAIMTAAFRCTRSAASAVSRSYCPSAHR